MYGKMFPPTLRSRCQIRRYVSAVRYGCGVWIYIIWLYIRDPHPPVAGSNHFGVLWVFCWGGGGGGGAGSFCQVTSPASVCKRLMYTPNYIYYVCSSMIVCVCVCVCEVLKKSLIMTILLYIFVFAVYLLMCAKIRVLSRIHVYMCLFTEIIVCSLKTCHCVHCMWLCILMHFFYGLWCLRVNAS